MEDHMKGVFKVLHYFQKSPGTRLFFKKENERGLQVYTDGDWAGSVVDRKSITCYCTFVWGNLINWRSKKQAVV